MANLLDGRFINLAVGGNDHIAIVIHNIIEGDAAEDAIAVWDRETELVSPQAYGAYLQDGQTRGFASLEKLEAAFEKVMREVKETAV